MLKIRPAVSSFVVIQRMFSFCVRQRGALRFFFRVSIIWFSFIKSRLFLSVKGYCVNMIDKIIYGRLLKNNTWSHVQLEENSLYTHARVLFSIYHINSNINGLWLLKQWKIGITNRQWRSNFPWSGRKLKKRKKTKCFVLSGFGNGISSGWEGKSILQLKDLPQRFCQFWPCSWKIFSIDRDQFNNWEFCMLKIRPIDCFCGDSTYVFILSAPSRHFTIFLSEYDFFFVVSILSFSFINEVDFSC